MIGNRIVALTLLTCLGSAMLWSQGAAQAAVTSPPTHPAGEIVTHTPVIGRPYGIAVSALGVVYTALLDTGMVARSSLADMQIVDGPIVGRVPSHLTFSPSGATAYVTNQGSEDVSVVDVATNVQTATIPVASDAWNVVVTHDGAKVYATTDQGDLYVIRASDNAVVRQLNVMRADALRGIALTPDGSRLYLAGRVSGNVYEIDTGSDSLLRVLPVGGTLQRLAVSKDGRTLYIANEAWGVDFLNIASGTIETHRVGGAYGLALSPDGEEIYAGIPNLGTVQVLDAATGAVRRTLNVGGRPRNIAFGNGGAYAVIANEWGWITFVK